MNSRLSSIASSMRSLTELCSSLPRLSEKVEEDPYQRDRRGDQTVENRTTSSSVTLTGKHFQWLPAIKTHSNTLKKGRSVTRPSRRASAKSSISLNSQGLSANSAKREGPAKRILPLRWELLSLRSQGSRAVGQSPRWMSWLGLSRHSGVLGNQNSKPRRASLSAWTWGLLQLLHSLPACDRPPIHGRRASPHARQAAPTGAAALIGA